nr:MAG TPA: hypothetical protein [Caudoviricetes sp.]
MNVTTITVQSQVALLFLWIQTKGILLSTLITTVRIERT